MGGSVSLAQAESIVDAALERGESLGLNPLTVAVLDAGGHLVVLKRQDRSGILRAQIAVGKAWGALGMRVPSRDLARRAAHNPPFYASLAAAADGRLFPGPGGVLVRDDDDDVLGAVGVSGDSGQNDEVCAIAGIEAVGLVADAESTDPH